MCNSSSQNFKKEQKLVIVMRRPKRNKKMTIVIKCDDIKVRRPHAPAVRYPARRKTTHFRAGI
jgi:hypothetical protein